MKLSSGRLALALAIPLLIVPLAGLTWLATQSIDQQESDMRARLRESLLLEVSQTNVRIRTWFTSLPDELSESTPRAGTSGKPTALELAAWKKGNPLIGIPFLLDASGSIIYPDSNQLESKAKNEETRLFYWRYLNVFGNTERIPVYRNIASEYESSIVAAKRVAANSVDEENTSKQETAVEKEKAPEPAVPIQPASLSTADAAGAPTASGQSPAAPAKSISVNLAEEDSKIPAVSTRYAMEQTAPEQSTPGQTESAPASTRSSSSPLAKSMLTKSMPAGTVQENVKPAVPSDSSALRSKVAQSIFETDTAVQQQVYELAAEQGKETLKRNVNPQIDAVNTKDSVPARSVYIESDRYFRDLVSQGERGLVPRIFDNSFVLLYWEKRGDWIVGCELDMNAVREAIAERSGTPADGVRYLAVLDQSGSPLIPIPNVESSSWRTPLVSGEISEFLPYWETAVILSDPSAFESRIRASRFALSALVLALFLSITGGAILLWRHSSNRLLEAKRRTSFVTTVTHELKTPLTSIRMYSEMLADGADLDRERRDRYLKRIVGESERLTRLINDVLDVAKLERNKNRLIRVPVDLAEVARETFDGIADRLKAAGFAVIFTSGDGEVDRPVEVMADREAVVRILINLLSNAEKYSGDEKEITITVRMDEKRKRGLVSVADRGIGIPRAHRSRIFKEFHRVDASLTSERGGTGLGLSIARALAHSLGGDLRYAPRDGGNGGNGSVFTLSLPAVDHKEGTQ